MKKISRRNLISTMTAASVGAAITTKAETNLIQTQPPKVFGGQHQPKPLPFDATKLKGISEKLIRSHWENNYGGAVKALNTVEQRLAVMIQDKDLPPYVYISLKREELIRTGSVVLHENYFANLGGNGKADGKALELIKQWFGSYEFWEVEFKRTATGLSGGSGWVVLAYNFHTNEVHNYWAWDHQHNAPMSRPLLVLDMYEHAYQMDYGAAAAKYIDAFMQNVNWDEVNRRVESSLKASL
jgi:Fe-Mn family superoxide dismutase